MRPTVGGAFVVGGGAAGALWLGLAMAQLLNLQRMQRNVATRAPLCAPEWSKASELGELGRCNSGISVGVELHV